MTVFRRIAKLSVTPQELMAYNPPKGIVAITLEELKDDKGRPKNQAYIEFVCSNYQPEPALQKNLSDIRHHLGDYWRNRIIEDNVTTHPKSPKRAYRIESILEHPLLTGKPIIRDAGRAATRKVDVPLAIRRAGEEARDVHEIAIAPWRMKSQLVIATEQNDPFWIKPKYVRQERKRVVRGPEDIVEEVGEQENMFDYGTIDEG